MPGKPRQVSDQTLARLERAQKAAEEGAVALAEHHANAKAVDDKTARLRGLRLAKEAAARTRKPERPK